MVCKTFHVLSGKVTHGVDNQAALTNCFGPKEPDMFKLGFNLVKKIQAAIKESKITWVGRKVQEH